MHIFHKRQGQMDFNYPYFYTQTIVNFSHLLKDDNLKMVLIKSLKFLISKKLIEVYGYVIMPNHIHLIWRMLKLNGKESPSVSFSKFTAHKFKKYLERNSPHLLENYRSDKMDRAYQFWKRDSLAIPLDKESSLIQKLDYIHDNPIKDKWSLSICPEDYKWSSAGFYLNGEDSFELTSHYKD